LITLDSISKHDFVMRVTGKKLEKRECVHIIKCAKVRALFAEDKVRFARAEQQLYMRNKSHLLVTLS